MNEKELIDIILYGRESRNIEYKRSVSWTDTEVKEKLTRTILAMSNIRDGGFIVIGMTRKNDDTYEATGIDPSHKETFNEDNMGDFIAEFADPYVHFSLHPVAYSSKDFLVIQINEFEEIPVICKRDGSTRNLLRGKTYTRSRRKPESIEVPSQSEMREILEVATDKGIRKFFTRLSKMGVDLQKYGVTTDKQFSDQIKDLEE